MRWSAGLLTAVERVLPLASLTGWRMLALLVKLLRRLLAQLLRAGAASVVDAAGPSAADLLRRGSGLSR